MQNNLSQSAINLTLDRLKGALSVKNDTQLADVLGVRQNTISSWRKRESLDYALVIAKCDELRVDLNWVFGKTEEKTNFQTKCVENVLEKNEDNFEDKNEDKRNVYKSSSNFQTKCVENVTVSKSNVNSNKNGNIRNVYKTLPFAEVNIDDTIAIPITDVSVAAGGGAFNADHHETNGAIQLPRSMLKRGTHLCVSVDGRSMEPTLQNGSMVVIRHLDRNEWAYLKDSSLYVITDREGSTYIKRITNNLHANGTLILRSDNSDKRRFSNITLSEDELFNIWAVEWCLSSAFPEAYAEVNERLDLMEGDMSEIKSLVRTIARETIKKP